MQHQTITWLSHHAACMQEETSNCYYIQTVYIINYKLSCVVCHAGDTIKYFMLLSPIFLSCHDHTIFHVTEYNIDCRFIYIYIYI